MWRFPWEIRYRQEYGCGAQLSRRRIEVCMLKNRTIKNAAWIIACKIVQSVLSMIITMLTARFLGPSNFGLVNYAASIVAFFGPIMYLGINSILVQELVSAPEKEGEVLGTAMLSCFVSGIFCILAVLGFSFVANHDEPITILVCGLYSLLLLAQAIEIISYWFQTHLLSKYSSIVSLVAYVVVSLYKAYLLFSKQEVYWFAISNALDSLLIAISLIVIYKKLGGQKFSVSFETFKRMISKGKYYILSGIMITVFSQTDRIMLKLMIDESATGIYSAAVACASMTSFIAVAIIDSARPSIFSSHKVSAQAFEKNMICLYSVITYFALIQSVVITVLAKLIIHILYGSAYASSASALRIIVWYTTFSYAGSVRNIWMLAENKQHLIWKIDISGAIANVAVNSVLIPAFGVNGAAMASLLTQIIANMVVVWCIREIRPSVILMGKSLNPKYLIDLIRTKVK